MTFEAFTNLSVSALRALAKSLHDGALSHAISHHPIEQIAGGGVGVVATAIKTLRDQGMTMQQVGLLVEAVAETRESIPDPSLVFELVLSGPSLAGIPTRHTAAVVRTLFADAQQHVLITGYAIHNGEKIFRPLHSRILAAPHLVVHLLFDVPRRKEHSTEQEAVEAFASDLWARHWPWPERPPIYYYPRSLATHSSERGSLHEKCVTIDRQTALITSANFTEAAQQRNIETGVLTRFQPIVSRLHDYFLGLIEGGLVRPLPER